MVSERPGMWRPLEPADAGQWTALLSAIQAADGGWEYVTEQDVAEDFDYPLRDYPRGSVAVYDGDTMVGYGVLSVRSSADPVHEIRCAGGVHPAYRGRGLGTRLLDWAQAAAVPLHQEQFAGRPMSVTGVCLAGNAGAMALYAGSGFAQARRFHEMVRDLTTGLAGGPAPAPAGVDIVTITPGRQEDARLVRNEAFRDHWGSTETTAEAWAHYTASHAFRPGLSFLAYAGGEPLGVVIAAEHEAVALATGRRDLDIAIVGTRRAGRQRGIATALLERVIIEARNAGYASASLGVDADSPTGAVGIYQRAGFVIDHTKVIHRKPVLP